MRPPASLDHLVGAGEDRWRHRQAERLCGFQVDDKLECGRLLDRQIGRLGSLEDLSGVNADQAKGGCEARSVADQAAGSSELAPRIYRRNCMARCQSHELLAPAAEERIRADDERAGVRWNEGRENGVDLAFAAGLEDSELHPLYARRFLHVSDEALGTGIVQGDHPSL